MGSYSLTNRYIRRNGEVWMVPMSESLSISGKSVYMGYDVASVARGKSRELYRKHKSACSKKQT